MIFQAMLLDLLSKSSLSTDSAPTKGGGLANTLSRDILCQEVGFSSINFNPSGSIRPRLCNSINVPNV